MSYQRVIPRDLFNEAKLLKCIGRLCLLIHDGLADLRFVHEGDPFEIQQDDDGDLFISNILFLTRDDRVIHMYSKYNGRSNYTLTAVIHGGDGEYLEVFTDAGELTEEFINAI